MFCLTDLVRSAGAASWILRKRQQDEILRPPPPPPPPPPPGGAGLCVAKKKKNELLLCEETGFSGYCEVGHPPAFFLPGFNQSFEVPLAGRSSSEKLKPADNRLADHAVHRAPGLRSGLSSKCRPIGRKTLARVHRSSPGHGTRSESRIASQSLTRSTSPWIRCRKSKRSSTVLTSSKISSPGVDRPLRHSRDYERFSGREARIHVFRPLTRGRAWQSPSFRREHPKQKNFLGVVKGIERPADGRSDRGARAPESVPDDGASPQNRGAKKSAQNRPAERAAQTARQWSPFPCPS